MAAQRVFQPAAQRVAVDRRDHRLFAAVHHVVGAAAERRALAAGAEAADVGAGDEAAAGADQHHGADLRIGVAAVQRVDDAVRHARPERIHRRIIHHDHADIAFLLQPYHRCLAHDVSSVDRRDRRQAACGGKPRVSLGCGTTPRQAKATATNDRRRPRAPQKCGAHAVAQCRARGLVQPTRDTGRASPHPTRSVPSNRRNSHNSMRTSSVDFGNIAQAAAAPQRVQPARLGDRIEIHPRPLRDRVGIEHAGNVPEHPVRRHAAISIPDRGGNDALRADHAAHLQRRQSTASASHQLFLGVGTVA